jgi:hypothetical protein
MGAGVQDELWNLEFIEAGRTLGEMAVAVLAIVKFLREKLPILLKNIGKIADNVAELTAAQNSSESH